MKRRRKEEEAKDNVGAKDNDKEEKEKFKLNG